MPSTEIQRIVLLVALAIVGYLLVYNWTRDYDSAPSQVEADAPGGVPATPVNPTGDAPADTFAPSADASSATGSDDIPDEDWARSESSELPAPDVAPQPQQLVDVRTPTQHVAIDLVGGDIVGLRLPAYPTDVDSGIPLTLLDRQPHHVYIAQSGLTGRDGLDKAGERPLYVAERDDYQIDSGALAVTLRHEAPDLSVVKRFRFDAESYLIGLEYEVANRGQAPFHGRLFTQLKRDASRPSEDGAMNMGPRPYVGAAFTTPDSRYEKVDFEDIDEEPFRVETKGGWSAILQHYFIAAWIGDQDEVQIYNGRRLSDGNYAVGFVGPEIVVPPGQTAVASAHLYAGPKVQKYLEAAAPNLYLTVDYGLLWWLSVPLFYVLDAIHSVVGNWGVAIILLTLVVKVLLFPLASAGFRSMAKMKQVMPQVQRLRERHAGDRNKLSQEMMALYRKEGANPLGGCLPLLLQMPVFFALYWVLYESVELRQAPFVLWIDDLAVRDPWLVLPLLYGASFWVMQLMQPPPPDPMQAKVMKMMPILFTVLFVFFPAGLVLYWLVNNLLSLAQQWYITRRIEKGVAAKAA